MNIENISSVNFGATKVISAKRNLLKGKSEVIDVYRFNYNEDYAFIKKCNELFASTKNKFYGPFEKKVKSFFSYLLDKTNAASEDFYIAVKNNEAIAGCLRSIPFSMDVIPFDLFTRSKKTQDINILTYALLKDSQREYSGFNINMEDLPIKTIVGKGKIKPQDIDTMTEKIKKEPEFSGSFFIKKYNVPIK